MKEMNTMENRQKKIRCLKNNLHTVIKNASYYTYGNIPSKLINGAINKYANEYPDDILALVDTTLFGNGGTGISFTEDGIWIKELFTETEFLNYFEYGKLYSMSDSYFVCISRSDLSDLMKKMSKIDDNLLDNSISITNGISSGLLYLNDILKDDDNDDNNGNNDNFLNDAMEISNDISEFLSSVKGIRDVFDEISAIFDDNDDD